MLIFYILLGLGIGVLVTKGSRAGADSRAARAAAAGARAAQVRYYLWAGGLIFLLWCVVRAAVEVGLA